MSTWNQLNEWLATMVVASLTWVFGVISPGMPPSNDGHMVDGGPQGFMIGWAQQVEQPPIEQVGEGTGDDVETLDEGTLPAETVVAADQEALDASAAQTTQDGDVEFLDQGTPPATAGQPVETVYVAPAADTSTTYIAPEPAPVVATGPVIPEGFGTGRVQAVAGRSGTPPVGLEDCHVGAVTGRAYVGIDCGEDEETSFVGHARSFDEFPFTVDADFPFEGDEAFFTESDFPFGGDDELAAAALRDDDDDDTDVFVSARGGARESREDESTAPVIETSGESSVQFAQRARDRDPRARVEDRSGRDKDRRKQKRADANNGRTNTEAREEDNRQENVQRNQVSADTEEDTAKDKKTRKDKKDKKDRADHKEQKKRSRDRG